MWSATVCHPYPSRRAVLQVDAAATSAQWQYAESRISMRGSVHLRQPCRDIDKISMWCLASHPAPPTASRPPAPVTWASAPSCSPPSPVVARTLTSHAVVFLGERMDERRKRVNEIRNAQPTPHDRASMHPYMYRSVGGAVGAFHAAKWRYSCIARKQKHGRMAGSLHE